MGNLLTDLRHGIRLARRAPLFAAITVATLALGIGANTAIYSVIDGALLRALPYGEPDRVVMVWEDASYVGFPRNTPAPANYFDWKARNRVFTEIAATRGATANLTADGPPEQVIGRRVTANFFAVLGVQPLLGRPFTEEEDLTGAEVAVISYGLWQRRYGGDAGAIGRPILMSGVTRTIIGVMPRGFVFRSRDVDFWTPMQFTPAEIANRGSHFLNVVARLRPGVTPDRAREDVQAITRQLAAEYPATNARMGAVVVPIKDDLLGDTRVELLVLMAAAGCVLLIACANLASLLLSRGLARRSEMAVRAALGADRGRLVRQMIAEAMLLAGAGGVFGLALAYAGTTIVAGLVPAALPEVQASPLDARLLAFTAALSVFTGLLFSAVPAMHAARASLQDALQGVRAEVGGRHALTRDALVVAQVAAALLLLVGAGLMLRTLANLRALDLGFRVDNLITMRTTLPAAKYPDAARRTSFYDRVVSGVRALPGVQEAAFVSTLPFMSQGNTTSYRIEGRTLPPDDPGDTLFRAGTADYLKTIGARLIEGRLPDRRDEGPDRPAVIVINETFARMYWAGESALGHRVRFGGENAPWRTIIGVVEDVRERGYELAMKPGTYAVYSQAGNAFTPEQLVIRADADLESVVSGARRVIAEVDPEQPVSAVRPMRDIIDLSVVDRRQQTVLLGAFAALALLLASIGLYGVLSYAVTRRRREIGLRIALGATRSAVVRLIVFHGLALTGIGLAIGVTLAWAGSRALESLLYGVVATDPATFVAVFALLGAVALAACGLPAWRAARLDPMDVLRQE
jgi:putative ABC transport system permease protein